MNHRLRRSSRALSALAILSVAGCSSSTAATTPTSVAGSASAEASTAASAKVSPENNVPTPGSITKEEPGGDAPDPELAALTTLAEGKVSRRWDKPEVLAVHLVDSKLWRRVKASALPSRVMFRYGDDTHALAVVMYQPSEGPDDTRSCLAKFMHFADDAASTYDITYEASPVYERERKLEGGKTQTMLVQLAEGRVNAPFFQDDYVGGIAAYPTFPGTCLVQAIAFIATDHPEAARRARDRWVNDAAPLLQWDMEKVGDHAPPFEDR